VITGGPRSTSRGSPAQIS